MTIRRASCLRLLTVFGLVAALCAPAVGQTPLPLPGALAGAEEATAPQAATPSDAQAGAQADAQALIDILEDDAARQRLVTTLEEIAAGSPDAAADAETAAVPRTSIGDQVVSGVPALVRTLARGVREDWNSIRATLRRLGGYARVDSAEVTGLLAELGLLFGISVGATVLGRLALMRLLRRMARAAVDASSLRRAGLVAAAILLDLLVLAAAMVLTLLVVNGLTTEAAPATHALLYLQAYFAAGALVVTVRAIFRPAAAPLRPLPMSDGTARYWTWHLTVIVVLIAFGELLIAPIVSEIASPITARATLVALYVLALLYLIVLILRNRKAPGAYLRHRAAENEDDIGLALLVPLARYWYVLALVYLLFLLHEAMTSGRAGLPLLVGLAKLLAALALGLLAVRLLNRLASRGISLSPKARRTFPGLEQRLNAFAPAFLRFLRNLVIVLWVVLALQAVGALRLGDWVEARFGIDILGAATSVILIVLVCLLLWIALSGWVDYRLASHAGHVPTAREQTLLALARNAGLVAILAVGLAYGLSVLGISVAPLLASAGVVGLAIGFGSQKLVQDIITGIFIQFENAINVGDVVEAGGKIGSVEKLTIRSVSLRDVQGVFHVVPFSSVDSVSNYMKGFSHHVADIGIAYREDIDAAKAEMLAAYDDLMADMQWSTKLIGGIEWFGVESLGTSSVVLRARLKTLPGQQWAIGRAYSELVKKRFDRAGIEIPYPHMTVWFGTNRDGSAPPVHLDVQHGRLAGDGSTERLNAGRQSVDPAGPTDADDD